MQFSIALSDLEHLTGLSGLTDQSGAALDARLREAFAFLPEDSEFSVDDQGVLHVNAPSAPEDAKSTAERHAHNCPIDMRIERTIRAEYPTLKQAQFCGVAQMAHEAQQASFSEKVRTAFPAPMLRLNDALNTAFALFVDDLFERATAFSEAYRPLPAYREGQKLYQLWQELDADTPVGEEWRMVDAFAERLGLTNWFAWRADAG